MGTRHLAKKCGDCQAWKDVDDFYPDGKYRDGYCKECRRDRDRARSERRSAVVLKFKARDPFYYRNKKLLKMYGITHEQYMEMHRAQGGVCKICRKPEKRVLYDQTPLLVVDHDHVTKTNRGLLCAGCNGKLGAIEDQNFLATALAYLQEYR